MTYKVDKSVSSVSDNLVQEIRQKYISYICSKMVKGESCCIYNMARVLNPISLSHETFAYQQYEISKELGISYEVASNVLNKLQLSYVSELLHTGKVAVDDLVRFYVDNGNVHAIISSVLDRLKYNTTKVYPTLPLKDSIKRVSKAV